MTYIIIAEHREDDDKVFGPFESIDELQPKLEELKEDYQVLSFAVYPLGKTVEGWITYIEYNSNW